MIVIVACEYIHALGALGTEKTMGARAIYAEFRFMLAPYSRLSLWLSGIQGIWRSDRAGADYSLKAVHNLKYKFTPNLLW